MSMRVRSKSAFVAPQLSLERRVLSERNVKDTRQMNVLFFPSQCDLFSKCGHHSHFQLGHQLLQCEIEAEHSIQPFVVGTIK